MKNEINMNIKEFLLNLIFSKDNLVRKASDLK